MTILLKKHDNVQVITGKSKGQRGKILELSKDKTKVWVEGVNKGKKHSKPTRENEQGGIIEKEFPVHVSNLMFVSPKSNEPIKLVRKVIDGKLKRVDKKPVNR